MWLLAELNLLKLKLPKALPALCYHQQLYSLALLKHLQLLDFTQYITSRQGAPLKLSQGHLSPSHNRQTQ